MTAASRDPRIPPRMRVRGIRKTFGSIQALRGVDLDLWPGECLGLVGDNAAGKSTFTKILAGTYLPDEGTIELDGKEIRYSGPAQARSFGVEMVYQDLSLIPAMTVAENIWLTHEPRRAGFSVNRGEMRARTRELLALFEGTVSRKLTPDTLPRVLTHYLDSTLDTASREWQRARDEATRVEGRAKSAAQRTATEWANTVDALRRFRTALEEVIEGPPRAEQVAANARWLARTIAQVRGGRDVGHGYGPDLDYGVRVNITPLVEKRLLPRVVLKRLGG